jgi:hypothetical protein
VWYSGQTQRKEMNQFRVMERIKVVILVFVILVTSVGCTTKVDITETREILALYEAPEIVVSYDEAVSTGGLFVDQGNQNISKQEFEEIFNLLHIIKNDPKSKELGIWVFELQNIYVQKTIDGYYKVWTRVYYEGPTYAGGQVLTFSRWPDGKYELVSIGRWVA